MNMLSLSARLALPALALPCLVASCGSNVVVDPASSGVGGAGGTTSTGTVFPDTGPGPTGVTSTTGTVNPVTSVSSTGAGTMTSTSTGVTCPSDPPLSGPCKPSSACIPSNSPCLAEVNQGGASTFDLRVAHLSFTQPAAFTKGLVQMTLEGAVTPNHASCNLDGTATFSWLLQFTAGGAVVTGASKPVQNPMSPYTFVNQMIPTGLKSFQVTPNKAGASFSGCQFKTDPLDVVLPIFLDATGTNAVVLPLHQLAFQNGTVSADHNCIGRFNAAGLDPASGCTPDTNHPEFIDGASFEAFFVLEETDNVGISLLQQSLCVLLSGDATTFGDGAKPMARCKRNAQNQIIFKGDWCSMGGPATPGCADALRFSGSFAASGVTIQ